MTVEAAAPDEPSFGISKVLPAVVGLGVTQIIGWGTSFSAIAVLGTPIGADLKLPREVVFAGVTIMLVVSGLVAPWVGRTLDRRGPRMLMAAGSCLAAVSLGLMAGARGPVQFLLAWAMFGGAVALALSTTALPALVQLAGPHARKAVSGLTILGGTTSLLFLPITAGLAGWLGWRGTVLVYAALHLMIALPIHLLILRTAAPPAAPADGGRKDTTWRGDLPERLRGKAFWLLVAWSCCEGMLVWGFNLQAVDLLIGMGLPFAAAIAAWMFSSPSQAIARIIDLVFGHRYTVMTLSIVSAALAPLGFLLFYAAGTSAMSAAVMATLYGLGHGIFVIARNMLPLKLFGMATFGTMTGRMALPQNVANALAPILVASLLARVGPQATLAVSAVFALGSLVAVLLLARLVKAPAPALPAAA
jgi:MFS family permease